jgi:hypothetical protein
MDKDLLNQAIYFWFGAFRGTSDLQYKGEKPSVGHISDPQYVTPFSNFNE